MKLNINELNSIKGNAYSSSRHLLNAVKFNEGKMIAESELISDRKKSGIIVFSEEAGTIESEKIIDIIAKYKELTGWTAGYYLSGKYNSKNGKCYSEKSLSVEIIGIDTDTMIKIAEQLCIMFKQESVLLKDCSNNRIMIIEVFK